MNVGDMVVCIADEGAVKVGYKGELISRVYPVMGDPTWNVYFEEMGRNTLVWEKNIALVPNSNSGEDNDLLAMVERNRNDLLDIIADFRKDSADTDSDVFDDFVFLANLMRTLTKR